MKICLFGDIHGNKEALEMLIKTKDFKSADLRICLGDVIIGCPYPNECCKLMLSNDIIWLLGNHDSYIIEEKLPKMLYSMFSKEKILHQHYMWNITKKIYKDKIKKLNKDLTLEINGKKFYFVHYVWTYKDNVSAEPKIPTLENISLLYKNIDANYIFYGHEHRKYHLGENDRQYFCVPALGISYPGTYYILNINDDASFNIEEKHIYFDKQKLINEMIKLSYPYAKEYTKELN